MKPYAIRTADALLDTERTPHVSLEAGYSFEDQLQSLETARLRAPSFYIFFACPSCESQKSGLEVRAPALRERDNNKPRDGAAAARRLARVTTQPSCEFVWFGRARFALRCLIWS